MFLMSTVRYSGLYLNPGWVLGLFLTLLAFQRAKTSWPKDSMQIAQMRMESKYKPIPDLRLAQKMELVMHFCIIL